MDITRYDPWKLMDRVQQDAERALGLSVGENRAWVPAMDVREEPDRFVIHADLPGVDPKDIDITTDAGVLTIRGSRETRRDDERNGYKRVERVAGTFERRFTLPDVADQEAVSADYRNGVLTVSIPKQPKALARRIEVKQLN